MTSWDQDEQEFVNRDDGTTVDLRTNLDEMANECGHSADFCAELAKYWLTKDGKDRLTADARRYRIRHAALLAAYYIEVELRSAAGENDEYCQSKAKPQIVYDLLRQLEERTCSPDCRELREIVESLCAG